MNWINVDFLSTGLVRFESKYTRVFFQENAFKLKAFTNINDIHIPVKVQQYQSADSVKNPIGYVPDVISSWTLIQLTVHLKFYVKICVQVSRDWIHDRCSVGCNKSFTNTCVEKVGYGLYILTCSVWCDGLSTKVGVLQLSIYGMDR